jgi:hypothetical protein
MMRIRLYALVLLFTAQGYAAAESATWEQLCLLLDVKRESMVFHQFSSEYGLQAFGKRDGNYRGRDGIYVNCVGDHIIYVGIRVSESAMKLPFGLNERDDLVSATRKLGVTPTDEQKENAQEYLELIVPQHQLVLQFIEGRLSKVGKKRVNQASQSTTPATTPPARQEARQP